MQDFSKALFDKQTEYFDVNVVNESRNNTYKRLAKLAGTVGVDESKIYKQLEVSDKPAEDGSLNTGNATTNDLKLLIKAARLTGVHVSPTVVFNVCLISWYSELQLTFQGNIENSISSSFTAEQWDEWLQKNIT